MKDYEQAANGVRATRSAGNRVSSVTRTTIPPHGTGCPAGPIEFRPENDAAVSLPRPNRREGTEPAAQPLRNTLAHGVSLVGFLTGGETRAPLGRGRIRGGFELVSSTIDPEVRPAGNVRSRTPSPRQTDARPDSSFRKAESSRLAAVTRLVPPKKTRADFRFPNRVDLPPMAHQLGIGSCP